MGLRTLVYAQRILTKKEADDYLDKVRLIKQMPASKQEYEMASLDETMESNLEYLGLTAIEDKL